MHLNLDYETRSRIDVTDVGAYRYARSAEILCAAYTFDDDYSNIRTWRPWQGEAMPGELREAFYDDAVEIHAWNAQFERLITQHCTKLNTDIRLERWRCTAARARASAFPGKLELCARALNIIERKDMDGNRLMLKWTKPLKDDGWADDPEEYGRLVAYCAQDVRVEAMLGKCLRDMTAEEWLDYHNTERLNDRGIPVDLALATAAIGYAKVEAAEINQALSELTNGEITTAKQFQRIKNWVAARAPDVMERLKDPETEKVSLDKNGRLTILDDPQDTPDEVLQLFELVDDGGRASTSKFQAVLNRADADQRVRGAYLMNGAGQTGRFCVDGETKIDTILGPLPIKSLTKGTLVRTHLGRWRPVMNLWYKGKEEMYRLTFADGATVTCTAGHRLLTNEGWRHVRELEGFTQTRRGDQAPVYAAAVANHDADRRGVGCNLPYGERCPPRGFDKGADQEALKCEQVTVQERQSQSDVWYQTVQGADLTSWLSGRVGRQATCRAAPTCCHAGVRIETATTRLGGPSYRRRQNEPLLGQFSLGNESWASEITCTALEKVEAVGSRGVWDIEVAEDHSYTAQGLVHHNSAVGFQPHNLVRDKLKAVDAVVEAVLEARDAGEITALSGENMLTTLARLLRPMVVADEGKTLVWADYSAVEARALPWLSLEPTAEIVLDYFRQDKDPYIREASNIYGVSEADILARYKAEDTEAKLWRQIGKVAVLALGFQGGEGAFRKMARAYGIKIAAELAQMIKIKWRQNNPWAAAFWAKLHNAAVSATRAEGRVFEAGRVSYLRQGSDLYCRLPCGRLLTYPDVRLEAVGSARGESYQLSALKGSLRPEEGTNVWPRVNLYGGIEAENVTQGICASLLRLADRDLEEAGWPVVMHTHDELMLEVFDDEIEEAKTALRQAMLRKRGWNDDLPLQVELGSGKVYGK